MILDALFIKVISSVYIKQLYKFNSDYIQFLYIKKNKEKKNN